MLKLAADENFNNDIVRGLLRRNPTLDIVRVQDVGLSGADDEGRVGSPRLRLENGWSLTCQVIRKVVVLDASPILLQLW